MCTRKGVSSPEWKVGGRRKEKEEETEKNKRLEENILEHLKGTGSRALGNLFTWERKAKCMSRAKSKNGGERWLWIRSREHASFWRRVLGGSNWSISCPCSSVWSGGRVICSGSILKFLPLHKNLTLIYIVPSLRTLQSPLPTATLKQRILVFW